MADLALNVEKRKGYGGMGNRKPPDLIAATRKMDIDAIKACLDEDEDCIHQTDQYGNNVMHVCIGGGTFRMTAIMEYFLANTDINLLQENSMGDAPIDLAIAINDQLAIKLLYSLTANQLNEAYPDPGISPAP